MAGGSVTGGQRNNGSSMILPLIYLEFSGNLVYLKTFFYIDLNKTTYNTVKRGNLMGHMVVLIKYIISSSVPVQDWKITILFFIQ